MCMHTVTVYMENEGTTRTENQMCESTEKYYIYNIIQKIDEKLITFYEKVSGTLIFSSKHTPTLLIK